MTTSSSHEGVRTAKLRAKAIWAVWSDHCAKNGLELFPVCSITLAKEFGIKVAAADMEGDFQGALITASNGKSGILYNENIEPQGRVNFTVAHELGHFVLHKDRSDIRCSIEDIEGLGKAPHEDGIEKEANTFSAELLMPYRYITQDIHGVNVTRDILSFIADKYGASLTAVACRVTELSPKPSAIIMLDYDNRCSWVFRNKKLYDFYIKKGDEVTFTENENGAENALSSKTWILTADIIEMPSFKKRMALVSAEPRY